MDAWPFDQAENVAAVTSRSVLAGAPVLLVVHYSDDHSWAFLDSAEFDEADGRLVGMGEILSIDPTLAGIADLPPGWVARRRAPGEPWAAAQDEEV
jgi:hypothetical protein